jgi:DNA-directed RNA polymerase specialized sigma24 family protein
VAAAEAVRLAMLDLARPVGEGPLEAAWTSLARDVYRHSQSLQVEPSTSTQLPVIMVRLSRLARLQRASLALCFYGRMTHREAATLLDVPPNTVADLLTAGLRELGRGNAGTGA